jgi:hypothetical protein
VNLGPTKWPRAPLILAGIFFALPVGLFVLYPTSFWLVSDNEPHGLADALNMAYRLADFEMYPALGLSYHPGVPFYLMSWTALALAGYPVATGGLSFFNAVLDHVETYHAILLCLSALVGAAGVYVFVRSAQIIAPLGVAIIGLLLWLFSSSASIMMFTAPGMESFAILINALFFAVLVPLAYEEDIDPAIVILAGCVGAFAYLNKLSYVYIPMALVAGLFAKLVFSRPGWVRATWLIFLFVFALGATVLAAAFVVIGWTGFIDVLNYHQIIILGSGLYGTGDQTVVSGAEIWQAIALIAAGRVWAVPLAVVGGLGLAISGLVTGVRAAQQVPVAVMSIASGAAASLSALIVLKHYDIHYTAGVSATLPSAIVAYYLVAKAWNHKPGFIQAAIAVAAVLLMVSPVAENVKYVLSSRSAAVPRVQADQEAIRTRTEGAKGAVYYTYKSPFAEFGETFVLLFANVPRLTYDYLQFKRTSTSSLLAPLATRDVGAYVIDKSYFPNVEAVKQASNLDTMGPKRLQFKEGDSLIELKSVFLLIPSPQS